VALTFEVRTYKWHVMHRLLMMHDSVKFHEILFIHLETVVQTRKNAYLTFISDLDLGSRNL